MTQMTLTFFLLKNPIMKVYTNFNSENDKFWAII